MRAILSIILVSIVSLVAIRCAVAADPEPIQLTKDEDIKDAANVNDAIEHMSDKVAECIQAKRAEPTKCFCLYPKEFSAFKAAAETALVRHPEWKDRVIFYQHEGLSVNLPFKGVSRQLAAKCE